MEIELEREIVTSGAWLKSAKFDEKKYSCHLSAVVASFEANVSGACEVALMPETMSNTFTSKRRFDRLLAAESIRQLKYSVPSTGLNKEQEHAAFFTASEKMSELIKDKDILRSMASEAELELAGLLRSDPYRKSIEELRRQLIVLLWNSLEILIHDVVRTSLNVNATLIAKLKNLSEVKEFFSGQSLMNAMNEHDFNLSGKLGDVFVARVRFDSLPRIRAVIHTLFESPEVDTALKSSDIHRLSQLRNLFVHKRGIVDEHFAAQVSGPLEVGSQFSPEAGEFIDGVRLVCDLGDKILLSASAELDV